jgi:O-antigen/teichoic acid export membrane protein
MSVITVAMALRLALRIVAFGVVATAMGAREFGAFATVSALVMLFSSFSGWGGDQLLFRRVGRSRGDLPRAMATSLAFLAFSAPPLIVLAVLIIPFAVDPSIPWLMIFFISISDIGFGQINGVAANCFQAIGRPIGNLWLTVGFGAARVVAALIWINIPVQHDALTWSYYYVGVSAVAAVVSLWLMPRSLCRPDWRRIAWEDWGDGFQFALQATSQSAFGSTDKPVIAALSNLETAGLYAAATRIVAAAGIPVSALLYSAYVRFFEVGVSGAKSSAQFAVRLLPIGIGLGAIGSLVTVALAPLAPHVLGASYRGTDTALLILAPLPVVTVVQSLGLDVVISIGRTGLRTLAQLVLPPLNILLCCLLVPAHGVEGAAWAALLARVVMAAASWGIVMMLLQKESAARESLQAGPIAQAPPAE